MVRVNSIVKGIHMNFIEIQSYDQIPAVAYFCSCFSSSFKLPSFDIEDLEEALLLDSSENNSIDDSTAAELAPRLIPELIVSLLQGCDLSKSWPSITTSNYQLFLRRLFRQKCEEYNIENPFPLDTDFHNLSLHTKITILNYLCDFRLDSANVEFITSQYEAESLRIEPLGYDANGSVYWYFFGTRLYREDIQKGSKKSHNEKVWQVICFTEQDWQNLANKFEHSKSTKESALYKVLVEDFLPSIPVLFKAKEAERRRRLFQRRSSARVKTIVDRQKDKRPQDDDGLPLISEDDSDNKLTYSEKYLKQKKKKLQEKIKVREDLQNQRALRAQRRSSSLSSTSSQTSSCDRKSFFNLSFDSVVEENLTRNSEICLSNKENILHSNLKLSKSKHKPKMPPTSTKLPGRQTNNSLSSITGQIVIEPPTAATTSSPGPSTSRKKKVKAEVFLDTDEVLQIGMHKVLQTVKNHDDAWPFMDPVEEEIAPRYYSIIKRPMDLLKMDEKLENGEYRTFTEFRTDFKLIVNNCRLYNGQNNEYTEMVNNLQVAFDRATKKYFDQSSSDEDPVLLEYPPIEPTNSRLNLSKEKEVKKEKIKGKEKKHVKKHVPTSDESENDDNDSGHKTKKIKETKHKDDKKGSHVTDKKKEKSTRGVKRKHKDKDKSDKPKSKKMKKDYSDDENEKFEFDSEQSDSEDEKVKEKPSDAKKVKNLKKNEISKSEKKLKKNEDVKQSSSKKKVKASANEKVVEKIKKTKKSEKFSKTNEKANNKKRKLEESFKKYSDSDSDESVQDLIEEKKTPILSKVESKKSKSKISEDKTHKKSSSTPKKSGKSTTAITNSLKKNSKKVSNNEDLVSMSSGSFSRSPSPLPSINSSALTEDLTNSFDCENDTSKSSKKKFDSSFRSDTPEIKDKFDLIKERRNKMNQEKEKEKAKKKDQNHAASPTKEKNHKLKETIEKLKIKNEKSKSQIEFMDEVLGGKTVKKETSIFDKLKNEDASPKIKGSSKKKNESGDVDEVSTKPKKSKSEKNEAVKSSSKKQKGIDKAAVANSNPNNKSKKQNKACLDVLDMETEQTLKDINKWLEHTPRFEYSSASNSPSRYMIDEIDMPSKMDDNDFRKPIPLMPSSPSASHTNFQSPTNTPKDFNLLKESNNNKQTALSQNSSVASTSNKKVGSKEPKRKSLKEKLQQLPRKKEVQRTIDRLQPGKTKGNLLHNIQNINKPEEFFPLGSREKPKEIKNSLIVQTDESSPKLSLGTVLDTQSFNFSDSDNKKDADSFDEISLKIDGEKIAKKEDDEEDSPIKKDEDGEEANEDPKDSKETLKDSDLKTTDKNASKPNLNAWFKAFGVPKKPKISESQEDSGKLSDNNDSLKTEGNYLPTHQRRLSTGSSVSERSSGSSPQVGLEERLGAPAPYPSPIGASPIMASPKTDEAQKASSSNFPNGSLRVGFYQDMTSTKSSPEKSCSPREMPSPYGQYSQQHLYSGAGSSASSGMYGNFYNPESAGSTKQVQQASYSKPTNSPASYYDQYKQPLSQESDFNNSMSPSTNPNSPYHSQQSSPYQQQPNSPFQSPSGAGNSSAGNGSNISQAPNSPYSQPNSPYQQPQPQQTTSAANFHQSSASTAPQHKPAAQAQAPAFNNQAAGFPQVVSNPSFNSHHQTAEQFSAATTQQNCSKPSDWNKSSNANAYNLNTPQGPNNFNAASQQTQSAPQSQNTQIGSQNTGQHHPQHVLANTENTFAQNQGGYNKKSLNEPQSAGTPSTTPLYGTNKLPDHNAGYSGLDMVKNLSSAPKDNLPSTANNKPIDGSKYLDLSKQQAAHMNHHPQSSNQSNQYQQMFDLSNYTKASTEFDMSKSKAIDMFNRSMPKNNNPITTPSCSTGPGFWGNSNKPMEAPAYGSNQNDGSKIDLSNKPSVSNLAGNNFLNNSVSHQQPTRSTPASGMDINYKQQLFNNPAASSMMDLTAFMRDFRQAEERYSLSGGPSSFYDKNITPHMFGKNLQQTNSSAALQQMFNNSMTTMAYNRDQQNMNLSNYHSRLGSSVPGSIPNTNQPTHAAPNPQVVEAKTKKQRKKKNASPEIPLNTHQVQAPNQIQQHHQNQAHQHSQHQQQLAHQQSFQSYGGLKIPSAASSTTDPAIALKSVVPGSAFNYGPTLSGLYGENPAYLDEFRGTPNPYYPPPPGLGHRSTPDPVIDKTSTNPPPAHPQAPSSPYHHLLPPHHPSRSSYPFMDPATLQQQYRMMLYQSNQAGYHPALGMQNWPPHM